METAGDTTREITFYLTIRPPTFGRSDVVLRLYRKGRIASETVVSTVKDDRARMVMPMSRMLVAPPLKSLVGVGQFDEPAIVRR
jgi:hypothetical protein